MDNDLSLLYGFELLMPDGSKPVLSSEERGRNLIESWTWEKGKSDSWASDNVGNDNFFSGSTKLFSLSQIVPLSLLQESKGLTPIATASVYIDGLDFLNTSLSGEAILTEECVVYSLHIGFKKFSFLAMHDDIIEIDRTSPLSSLFSYSGAAQTKNRKYKVLGQTDIEIILKPSNDGHENRKTFIFWYSLLNLLKKKLN
jgi:hypothetical protein